jgi:hypothetical protein
LDQSFSSHVNDIAIHYILKQNVIDLLRLTDKEYSDNLIVLVSNVFDKNLTHEEIGLLNSHIESETIQEAVLDLIPSNETAKKKMLMNISKYYIKIMMIYSAIVSTLDPQYTYEDEAGEKQVFYLKDVQQLKKIPKGVSPVLQQLTNPMNLCKRRVNILKNKLDDTEEDVYILNPGEKVCESDTKRTLNDEVGIKELDLLYYDVFDYGQKTWKTRSPEMEAKYDSDLTLFFQTFTGQAVRPASVKSFKDIELLDLRSLAYCTDPLFTQTFTVPKTNPFIKRYVEEIKRIEEETKLYRETLNAQLNVLFTMNAEEGNVTYTINPKLTMKKILETEEETREIIRALYTDCERRFVNALILFEKIYDEQTKDLKQQQYNQLQKGNVVNTNRNKTNEVEIEEEPLYNKALYVNKPIDLPAYVQPQPLEQPVSQPLAPEPVETIPPMEKKDLLDNGLANEQKTVPFGLETPLSETTPSTQPVSWLTGITNTISQFSATKEPKNEPPKEMPTEKAPETNTFGFPISPAPVNASVSTNVVPVPMNIVPVPTAPTNAVPSAPANAVTAVPVEKDIFGYPLTPTNAVPKPMNTMPNPTNAAPKPVNMVNTMPKPTNTEPVKKEVDFFGYPIQNQTIKNTNTTSINTNMNKNKNIVLKPIALQTIEKPMNTTIAPDPKNENRLYENGNYDNYNRSPDNKRPENKKPTRNMFGEVI